MKMNKSMKKLLGELSIVPKNKEVKLEARLVSLLMGGIVDYAGCFFLRDLLPANFDIQASLEAAFDQTGLECEINHIHVDDYVGLDKSIGCEKFFIEQGMCYAFSLQKLLCKSGDFKIILSCTFGPIFDCNIRFHKKRLGEIWLEADLEKCDDSVMVLE